MIKIGIVGEIGSGKTFFSKLFKFPIFDADKVVSNLYKEDQNLFRQIKRKFPKEISSFPLRKEELLKIILKQSKNLKVLGKMIHPKVRKKMNNFLKKHRKQKIIILDIPLLMENKINKKKDVLVYVDSKKSEILKRLKKRKNFSSKLLKKFQNIQLSPEYKKKKSHFIINNNFTKKSVKKGISHILKEIL